MSKVPKRRTVQMPLYGPDPKKVGEYNSKIEEIQTQLGENSNKISQIKKGRLKNMDLCYGVIINYSGGVFDELLKKQKELKYQLEETCTERANYINSSKKFNY